MATTTKSRVYGLRDELLALSAAERANLLAMIEQKEVSAPYQPSRQDREVWDSIIRLCPPGMKHHTLDQLLRDKQDGVSRQRWKEAVETLGRFCAQTQPVRRTDEDRAALVDLALECLANEMAQHGTIISPKTIIGALPRLQIAVDQAFPGYCQAGMLHKLIRLARVSA